MIRKPDSTKNRLTPSQPGRDSSRIRRPQEPARIPPYCQENPCRHTTPPIASPRSVSSSGMTGRSRGGTMTARPSATLVGTQKLSAKFAEEDSASYEGPPDGGYAKSLERTGACQLLSEKKLTSDSAFRDRRTRRTSRYLSHLLAPSAEMIPVQHRVEPEEVVPVRSRCARTDGSRTSRRGPCRAAHRRATALPARFSPPTSSPDSSRSFAIGRERQQHARTRRRRRGAAAASAARRRRATAAAAAASAPPPPRRAGTAAAARRRRAAAAPPPARHRRRAAAEPAAAARRRARRATVPGGAGAAPPSSVVNCDGAAHRLQVAAADAGRQAAAASAAAAAADRRRRRRRVRTGPLLSHTASAFWS